MSLSDEAREFMCVLIESKAQHNLDVYESTEVECIRWFEKHMEDILYLAAKGGMLWKK